VVYPEFIPRTTFCVLSTLWNRGITILGLTRTALASGLLIGQQMSRASLLIPGLAVAPVGHCYLFLAFWQIIGIRVEK